MKSKEIQTVEQLIQQLQKLSPKARIAFFGQDKKMIHLYPGCFTKFYDWYKVQDVRQCGNKTALKQYVRDLDAYGKELERLSAQPTEEVYYFGEPVEKNKPECS